MYSGADVHIYFYSMYFVWVCVCTCVRRRRRLFIEYMFIHIHICLSVAVDDMGDSFEMCLWARINIKHYILPSIYIPLGTDTQRMTVI